MRVINPADAESALGYLGVSEWVCVDQAMIDTFADLTDDHQFIHVDPVASRATQFGGTIAHGFLTLALLTTLAPREALVLAGYAMGVNYGFDRIRFIQPVRSGCRVRAHHTLLAVEGKGDNRFLTTTEVTVEIEGHERPALVAQWLGMQFVTDNG